MAKGNKKTRELRGMNKNFDSVLSVLDDMAEQSREIMPLFADSLGLSKNIVKMYKKAFNQGIKNAK